MPDLVYLVGMPGAGKTTALRAAIAPWGEGLWQHRPFEHVEYGANSERWLLGNPERGTDALAMDAVVRVVKALEQLRPHVVVGEGARLANEGFFGICGAMGYNVRVLWLDLPEQLARQRAEYRGSSHSAAWARGRGTATERIAARWCSLQDRIDATQEPAQVAARVADAISLAVQQNAA